MKINSMRTKKLKENISVEVEVEDKRPSLSSYEIGESRYRKQFEVRSKYPDLWRHIEKFSEELKKTSKTYEEEVVVQSLIKRVGKRYKELNSINERNLEETQQKLQMLEEAFQQMIRGIIYEMSLKTNLEVEETLKRMFEEENRKLV